MTDVSYFYDGNLVLLVILKGAERPKNLTTTRKYEILRSAQDDKMVFRRGLDLVSD
jgi:hypothetical protein